MRYKAVQIPAAIARAFLVCALLLGLGSQTLYAQDILSSQLRSSFGKNKVRYKDFKWWILESEHLDLHYEPEFHDLALNAIDYLEEGYDHIGQILKHDLSTHPPIVIYRSHYEFQQTNIIHQFLPPGVAGFAEPLRYRMVIPFDGDLDEFRNVLVHELCHIFEYDILYKGPIKRLSSPLSAPPTWIMEGLAEYVTPGMNTIDEMVLRDAVLTDQLIPLEVMNAAWGMGNVFLAYKQSHSLMDYIAENYGPEKISRILRVWDRQNDTDKLLERLIGLDMEGLHDRWSAHMKKKYWPLLQTRDFLSTVGEKVVKKDDVYRSYANPKWSLSGDMLAVLSTDGVEQHVDIVRLRDGSLVERITHKMRSKRYDHLTFNEGTVAWAPDGHTIAFVGKKGPKDVVLLWDLYQKKLQQTLRFDNLEIVESLAWAPDSRQLAFVGTGYGQSDIYIVDVATGGLKQVTGTPQRDDYPAFSPDGTKLAYSAKYHHQFDIKIHDLESGETRTAISSPTDDLWPNWLPEGNKLLYVSTREHINDLFVYHLEQEQEYRLTRTLSGIMSPALSPDGRKVVVSTYYNGRRELYLLEMPSWPDVKRRDAELLARVGRERPVQPQAGVVEMPADKVELASAAPQGEETEKVESRVREAVAMLDQKKPGSGNIELLYDASQDFALQGEGPAPTPTPGGGEKGLDIDLEPDDSGEYTGDVNRRRYTPKLEFDGLSLQMGYYGGFLSSVAWLSMSDLLGNHSLSMATDYVASQEIENDFNFALNYVYYGRRPTYNISIFNWNQFYNDGRRRFIDTRGRVVSSVTRVTQRGMLADMSYPLDLYRRIDLSYSYVSEDQAQVWPIEEPINRSSTHLLKTAYVHDSINYGLLGATSGKSYYVSLGRTLDLSSDNRSFSHVELDYRNYIRLGRWSVMGWRLAGVGSLGSDPLTYNLGGPAWFVPFYAGFNLNSGPLRGYNYAEFDGSRVLLMNTELRVPFIRQITFAWPAIFTIPAVDGSFFLDVGAAWDKGEDLDLWPLHFPESGPEPPGEERLRAGMGFGLLVYFILPMNFEFARQTDLRGNYSDYRMHFSFGQSF